MGFVAVSPIIGICVKELKWMFLVVLFVLAESCCLVPSDWVVYRTCFGLPLLCFAGGGYLAIHSIPLTAKHGAGTKWAVVGAWMGIVYLYTVWSRSVMPVWAVCSLDTVLCLLGIYALWEAYDLFQKMFLKCPERLTHFTFFIYCFHLPLIYYICFVMSKCGLSGLPLYAAQAICAVGASLATGIWLSRNMPKLYNTIAGGR